MDNKTKDAIKQLQAEMRQLHAQIASAGFVSSDDGPAPDDAVSEPKGRSFAVRYVVSHASSDSAGEPTKETRSVTLSQISQVSDVAAAALGYAIASPQKVALLRALLNKESDSAAALGQAANLSTGSLYHHLRELMRSDLVRQGARNQYNLTARGIRTLLVLLALAFE